MSINYSKAVFKTFNSLKKSSGKIYVKDKKFFNEVVKWLNGKFFNKSNYLYTFKNIKTNKYTVTECNSDDNSYIYYLRAGELLALLYILNIKNLDQKDIISINECPVVKASNIEFNTTDIKQLFYASEIAEVIIDTSVYKLNFLPENKIKLKAEQVFYIKKGFSLVYNIAIKNKTELMTLINQFIDNKNFNLCNVLYRVQNLNYSDMKNQLYFIEVRFLKDGNYKKCIDFSKDHFNSIIDKETLMNLACKIGNYIIERSIIGYKDSKIERTWIGTTENGTVAPIGNSLYDGNSGVALFFGYLGAVTDKEYFTAAAMETMEPVLRYIKEEKDSLINYPKALSEIIGAFYTISKLYKLTLDEKIKKFIQDNITFLYELIEKNKEFNALSNAVDVNILLSIYKDLKNNNNLKDRLLKLSSNTLNNLQLSNENTPLAISFYGGISGAICSTSKLLELTKTEVLENLLQEILKLQRQMYKMNRNQLKSGWFNGLSGVLLSKLSLKRICYTDALLDKEIQELIDAIIKSGFGNNPYYAYGQLGNLATLNYAAETIGDNILKNNCDNTFNLMIDNVFEAYILKRLKFSEEPVSLTNGLSGLGYSLLRRCNKDLVPEILLFE